MPYVTCLNPIAQVGLQGFGADYQMTADLEQANLALVRSADLHGQKFPPQLLAIGRAGAGVNNIPLDECAQQGIVVFNTPGANANGVKELVLAALLLSARDVVGGIAWTRQNSQDPELAKNTEKAKKQFAGTEIQGKRLGVVGLGNIGVKVANAALALGMEVWGYTLPMGDGTVPGLDERVRLLESPEELYACCDYITLHLPLLADNAGMINQAVLDTMKPNAVLLNFSRDKLVDELALEQALQQGKLGGYVTDFPNPVSARMPRTLVLPHLGASTQESEDNCAIMAVDQLKAYLEEGTLRNSVNYPACTLGPRTQRPRLCVLGLAVNPQQLLEGLAVDRQASACNGTYSCLVADLRQRPTQEQLARLQALPGVTRVRLLD